MRKRVISLLLITVIFSQPIFGLDALNTTIKKEAEEMTYFEDFGSYNYIIIAGIVYCLYALSKRYNAEKETTPYGAEQSNCITITVSDSNSD